MSRWALPTDWSADRTEAGAAADADGSAGLGDAVGLEEMACGGLVVSQCRISDAAMKASAHPATRPRRVRRVLNPLSGASNSSPHQIKRPNRVSDRSQLNDDIKAGCRNAAL